MNSLPLALNYTLKVPPNLDHLMFPIFVTRQIHYTENEQTMSLGHKYTIFYLQWLATLTYYWISIVECKLSAYLCCFIRSIHIVCLRRYWTPEERTSELFFTRRQVVGNNQYFLKNMMGQIFIGLSSGNVTNYQGGRS